MRKNASKNIYRPFRESDIPGAMRLKDEAGWNQTVEDWSIFLTGGQHVNFVALDGDKVVGTVTGINYEGKVAWIGMMIVDKACRGMGISKRLMSMAIDGLRKNCASIKLDATPLGQPVYAKLGFHEEYTILRMVNECVKAPGPEKPVKGFVRPLATNDIDAIIRLDSLTFGAGRSNLIRHLAGRFHEKSFIIEVDGEFRGFVMGRDGTKFVQIGPVAALQEGDAHVLISMVLHQMSGNPVVIDVPEDKKETRRWLEANGFEVQRPLYRMYLEENPYPGLPAQQFAICGPEFG